MIPDSELGEQVDSWISCCPRKSTLLVFSLGVLLPQSRKVVGCELLVKEWRVGNHRHRSIVFFASLMVKRLPSRLFHCSLRFHYHYRWHESDRWQVDEKALD